MVFKKAIRSLHLFLGLLSGIVVFTVAVTGCIYAFEKEIRDLVHRELYTSAGSGPRIITASQALESVKQHYRKQKIRNIILPAEQQKTIQVNLKNKVTVFVDPYTGKIVGELDQEKEFLAIVLKLHRQLLLGEAGKKITGVSALIFLLMLCSGIILWWPRSRRSLRHKTRLTFRFGLRRSLFDLHNVLGFYASWILLFTVLSGLVMSFKWAERAMYTLAGSTKEERKEKSAPPKQTKPALEISSARLLQAYPGKQMIIVMPEDSAGTYRMSINRDEGGFYNKVDHYFVDQYSGEVLRQKKFEEQNAGEKLRATNLNIHTGKVLGRTGQILVFFAGLVAASLPVTGFMLWNNKRQRKTGQLLEDELSL